jgi:hypothetical protein
MIKNIEHSFKPVSQTLELAKIDSLKLRIPRHKVSYVDSTFAQEYKKIFVDTGEIGTKKNPKTGEFEEHINLDKHKVDVTKGISSRIAVFHSLQGGQAEEQIVIQCNSKQLKHRYFEGITWQTIKDLYEYIIGLNIIYVDYRTFLNAYVSDIDFAYDVKVSKGAMMEANQEIYRNVLPSCHKFVGKPFRKQSNIGIQFNVRDKATPSRPYVKIYHKTTEFETHSNEFAEAFLKGQDYSDIGRLEFTLKNTKHRKHLDIHITTMKDLLDLPQETMQNVCFSGIGNYLFKKEIMREFKDLSPTDRLILHFINKDIEHGADKQSIYAVLHSFDNPQERSRMKKKLTQLLEQVQDGEKLVANAETMNFLRALKLQF